MPTEPAALLFSLGLLAVPTSIVLGTLYVIAARLRGPIFPKPAPVVLLREAPAAS